MQLNLSPIENLKATKQDTIHRNKKWHKPTHLILPRFLKNMPMKNHFQVN